MDLRVYTMFEFMVSDHEGLHKIPGVWKNDHQNPVIEALLVVRRNLNDTWNYTKTFSVFEGN